MTTEVISKKSSNPRKKYDAVIDGKKTVSFGATGYSDFTKHKDEERKKNHIDRHRKMKTGKTIKPQVSMLKIFFGTNQLLKHQLRIQTKSFQI